MVTRNINWKGVVTDMAGFWKMKVQRKTLAAVDWDLTFCLKYLACFVQKGLWWSCARLWAGLRGFRLHPVVKNSSYQRDFFMLKNISCWKKNAEFFTSDFLRSWLQIQLGKGQAVMRAVIAVAIWPVVWCWVKSELVANGSGRCLSCPPTPTHELKSGQH